MRTTFEALCCTQNIIGGTRLFENRISDGRSMQAIDSEKKKKPTKTCVAALNA